jgi:hypothetical protein
VPASTADIGDGLERGEIVLCEDSGDLAVGLPSHGLGKDAAVFGPVRQIFPHTARRHLTRRGFTRAQGVSHQLEHLPEDREADHGHEGSHGLGVIAAQQTRCGRVDPPVVARFENSVGREQAQSPAQGIRVGAGGRGQIRSGTRIVAERIGNPHLGDQVQTSRRRVDHRNFENRVGGIFHA